MPGITGIISDRPPPECQRLVKTMVESMLHEGFYKFGHYSAAEFGIYAGWIAHDCSFAGGQVFSNQQRDLVLLFSGECFADASTDELPQDGRAKWLLQTYQEEGERLFTRLNGLFSGLLIDKRQKRAYLFNDRYGTERIYYHEGTDGTYFASEAKALLSVLPETRAFDDRGVADFLAFGCTLDWRTLFHGIQLLPGGSLWSFEEGRCIKRRYFSSSAWELQAPLPPDAYEVEFQAALKRILPRYLHAPFPVGIALTGGLDTRMIMAFLQAKGLPAVTYTFAGQEKEPLDVRLGRRVAEACGLLHHTIRLGPDFLSNFSYYADRTVYVTDGCYGVTGAHEIYLNAQARQLSPTRLTGSYGSEVLRGMSTFKRLGLASDLLSPGIREIISAATRIRERDEHPISFAVFREIPWNLYGNLAANRSQVILRTPYLDNELVGLAFKVPAQLRTSSAPGIRLIQATSPKLARIPTDRGYLGKRQTGGSFLLKRLFAEASFKLDYFHQEGLPRGLSWFDPVMDSIGAVTPALGLHKFLHYRRWFRKELAEYVSDSFHDSRTRNMPYWNSHFTNRMASDHLSGRRNYTGEINAVLTLSSIQRLLIEIPQRSSANSMCEAATLR